MGILNVTPDSFSDGGRFLDPEAAVEHAGAMIAEGADILDIGAESTRPGSTPVSVDEQVARLEPVLPRIRAAFEHIPISIDTQSAAVAHRAIALGADIINDVSAATADGEMVDVVKASDVPIILMHMRGVPLTMQSGDVHYDDVVEEVLGYLQKRVATLVSEGIVRERLAIDPGIGFGKTTAHNLLLLKHLDRFVATGCPVLVGASRKRFIGDVTDVAAENASADGRLPGSIACAMWASLAGVQMIRIHDVGATKNALRMIKSIRNASSC